jgi:hypothetical protein
MQTGLELQNKFIFTAQMGMGKKVLQKASHTPLSFSPGQEKIFLCPGKKFSLGIYLCFSNKKKQSTDLTKPIDCSVCYPLTIYKTKLNNFNI